MGFDLDVAEHLLKVENSSVNDGGSGAEEFSPTLTAATLRGTGEILVNYSTASSKSDRDKFPSFLYFKCHHTLNFLQKAITVIKTCCNSLTFEPLKTVCSQRVWVVSFPRCLCH